MKKIEKLCKIARGSSVFAEIIMPAFKKKFRRNLTTRYQFLSGVLISEPTNGKPFTPEQKGWVGGFDEGFMAALELLESYE